MSVDIAPGPFCTALGCTDEAAVIDPAGDNGIPFEELIQRVRTTLLEQQVYPGAGDTDVSYTDLRVTNEGSQSDAYADLYRHDLDIVFNGFETLPK